MNARKRERGGPLRKLLPLAGRRAAGAVLFLLIVLPAAAAAVLSAHRLEQAMRHEELERREALAVLSAAVLKERFDRLVDLGVSLATRVRFRDLVAAGAWEEAAAILESVSRDFPYVHRVFLADASGILRADTPRLAGVVGQDFSFRDWYRGATETRAPYISEVYQRAAEPRINVVAVAVPIFSAGEEMAGILVMQVSVETFLDWASDIPVGSGGYVYFVDRNGSAVGHPFYPPHDGIAGLAGLPPVRRALGDRAVGVETYRGEGIERLREEGRLLVAAHAPVPGYGWGALVEQPSEAVFAGIEAQLFRVRAFLAALLAFTALLAIVIVRVLRVLHREHLREETLLSSIGDGVVAIDRDFVITRVNRAAVSLSGWSEPELVGAPFRERFRFIRERDRKENVTFIEEAMLFKETRSMENHTVLVTKDGRELPVGDSAAPIIDSAGNVLGAIVVFRDSSKEKEQQSLRSDFAYASHQLRTPVNKARWHIELALEEAKEEGAKEALGVALRSMSSVTRLMNHLLEVSQLDQGTVMPNYRETSLKEIVEEAVRSALAEAGTKDGGVAVKVEPDDAAAVTDGKLLGAALSEVVLNAIQYGGREVRVRAELREHEAVIAVSDGGRGIREEEKPLIFTRFFRGGNFETTDIPGAGLGLHLAKRYLELLGGRIWFESAEGKGTTFSISVPRR